MPCGNREPPCCPISLSTKQKCRLNEGPTKMKKLLLLASLGALAYGQSDTASLSGAVTDPGSASIVGARITLRNVATRSARETLTDIQGLYRFSLLIPGSYEITIEAPGMRQ